MSFVERAFTPPGAGGAPLGSPANPIIPPPALAPTPVAPPPAPPAPPTAAPEPPMFQPGQAPAARQRAQVTGTTLLGAAATAGQLAGGGQAKRTLLG